MSARRTPARRGVVFDATTNIQNKIGGRLRDVSASISRSQDLHIREVRRFPGEPDRTQRSDASLDDLRSKAKDGFHGLTALFQGEGNSIFGEEINLRFEG